MHYRTLLFVLLLFSDFLQAETAIYPVPFKEKMELLDAYADHSNWKENAEDPSSWLTYDPALDEWEWPELKLPQRFMQFDAAKRAYLLLDEHKKPLKTAYFLDLKIIYHPSNQKFYLLYQSKENQKLGLMDLEGNEILKPNYRFLEVMPWGNKKGEALLLYSKIASANYFTKLSEVNEQQKVFGCINLATNEEEEEQFFKVFLLPDVKRYFCATYLNAEEGIKYALYDKDFEALTSAIFERTECLKKDWTFEDDGIFEGTEEAGIARPLAYNRVIDQATIILRKEGKAVLYDYDGKELIAPKWDSLFRGPREELCRYKNRSDQGVGLLNMNMKSLLEPIYEDVLFEEITEGLFAIAGFKEGDVPKFALFDGKYSALTDFIFDANSELVLEQRFDPLTFDHQLDSQYSYLLAIDQQQFYPDLLLKKDAKACLYSRKAVEIIPAQWDSIQVLEGLKDLFAVELDNVKGLINRKAELLISTQYDEIEPIGTDGLRFIAKKEGAYLLIDVNGKKLKRKSFKDAYYAADLEVLVLSKNAETYALFSPNLKRLTAYKFKVIPQVVITFDPNTFEEIIDTHYIRPCEDKIDTSYNTVILETKKGVGLYSNRGEELIPAKYKKLSFFWPRELFGFYIRVELDNERIALFDQKGKQYTDFIYRRIYSSDESKEIYGFEKNKKTKKTLLKFD